MILTANAELVQPATLDLPHYLMDTVAPTVATVTLLPEHFAQLQSQMVDLKKLVLELHALKHIVPLLNVNLRPSFRFMADSSRFSSRILLYFAPSIVPSILTSLSVPTDEKHNMKSPTTLGSRDCVDWVACRVRLAPEITL